MSVGRYVVTPHGPGSPRLRRRPAVRPPHRGRCRGRRAARRPGRRSGVEAACRTSSASGPGPNRRRRRLPLPAGLAHRLWAHADWPRARPVARRRRGRPRHELRRAPEPPAAGRVGVRLLVPRQPRTGAPAVRRAGAVLRRAAAGARASTPSSAATADQVRELLGTERVEVVHLGPLPSRRSPALPATRRGPARRPAVRPRHRHDRAAQEPARARRGVRQPRPSLDGAGSSSPARPATTRRPSTRPLAAPRRRRPRRACIVRGRSTTRPRRGCSTTPPSLAYPSLDEGFGFPILEAQTAGRRSSATRAGSIPEVAGDGAELVAAGDPMRSPARSSASSSDDDRRRALVAAGHRQRRPVLVDARPPSTSSGCTPPPRERRA